ncbi:MAG TPA: hypothetical protein HA283_05245 [Nanoarchaeota archaeon]|nr:hypothetical protein [Nanoarchaeota archaeon]HIH63675.1 hypothetical protein [Nanoarchaeota archaeon]HIJ10070.1 hypothetical protein [Nanoarchaeota archaeon]
MKNLKNLFVTGLILEMLSLPKVVVSPVQNVNLDREIFTDKSTSGILYVNQNNNGRYDLVNDRKSILFHGYSSDNKNIVLNNLVKRFPEGFNLTIQEKN